MNPFRREWRCSPCMFNWHSIKKKLCPKCGKKPKSVRRNLNNGIKETILEKYKWTCIYCRDRVYRGIDWWMHPKEFSIDHILPLSKGGSDNLHNLVLSCRSCNSKRGNRQRMPKTHRNRQEGRFGAVAVHYLKHPKSPA